MYMHIDSSHCSNENAIYSTKPMKLEFNNYALHKPRDHESARPVHTACTPINVLGLGLQLRDLYANANKPRPAQMKAVNGALHHPGLPFIPPHVLITNHGEHDNHFSL